MSGQGEFKVSGTIVDVEAEQTFLGSVHVVDGRILSIRKETPEKSCGYILPGFVDAHVHVESSLLSPQEFARLAVRHGTVATVSDPHEIANVLGVSGVRYMLEQAEKTPLKINFGAPSCVPATMFETAGAMLGVAEVSELLADSRVRYLAEVMNFPGVLQGDVQLLAMMAEATRLGKQIDGHAPGLRGEDAKRYAAAGPTTDHECFSEAEARDKLAAGMHILIREGSAAKNFEALIGLLEEFPERMMFCTDDAHPDLLCAGHIDVSVRRAIAKGISLWKVLRAACLNPVKHYGLDVGLLRPGDPADFIVVEDLREFRVRETYVQGQRVAENGRTLLPYVPAKPQNNFKRERISQEELQVVAEGETLRVIQALDGQLITKEVQLPAKVLNGSAVCDPSRDLAKLVVVNRYDATSKPAVAFVRGLGLKAGALASSVAHDSHNVVAAGTNDSDIVRAVNLVCAAKGGLAYVHGTEEGILPLPIAGLMSDAEGDSVASAYSSLDAAVKSQLGSTLRAPFMTLSFLALLVIPSLKLSDKGLFDGERFRFTNLFV